MNVSLADVISALEKPHAYGHGVRDVRVLQTHISYVVLAGDFAYKIKKPVDFGFVDYSTLGRRRMMCEEEVRLNRRLCSGVYLDVVPITRDAEGDIRVEGSGEPIEYAVKMARVPDAMMMPALLEAGGFAGQPLVELARRIARFHRETPTSDQIAAYGSVAAVMLNWDENFLQTDHYVGKAITGAQLDAIRMYAKTFLRQHTSLFEQRAKDGRIRDCHGDLRADSVVLNADGSICVMDCIEFNERLRYGDVASDVAFLAMDVEARGFSGIAEEFISAYLDDVNDETFTLVFNFYRAYRASIRGKVECMLSEEPEVEAARRASAIERAARYFDLAVGYTRSLPPTLVVMAGLSGSGKSWLAHPLAARMPAAILRSDQIRRTMTTGASGVGKFGQGAYSKEARASVYDEMMRRAGRYLDAGHSVVLDATFSERRARERARGLARARGVRFMVIETHASDDTIRQRMAAREDGTGASGARWDTYLAQRDRFEPINEMASAEHMRVESSIDLGELVQRALQGLLAETGESH